MSTAWLPHTAGLAIRHARWFLRSSVGYTVPCSPLPVPWSPHPLPAPPPAPSQGWERGGQANSWSLSVAWPRLAVGTSAGCSWAQVRVCGNGSAPGGGCCGKRAALLAEGGLTAGPTAFGEEARTGDRSPTALQPEAPCRPLGGRLAVHKRVAAEAWVCCLSSWMDWPACVCA